MNSAALQALLTRRSVKAVELCAPAPSAEDLDQILTAASRVPDHGKAVPFYFIVIEGQARHDLGDVIADRFVALNPDAPEDKIEAERNRLSRAPLVVAVVSRERHAKHPLWEQILTAGAVCQNLLHAVHAQGFAGQWLSEWFAYDTEFTQYLGLDKRDRVAAFMHIGTPPSDAPADRDRPDLSQIVTRWDGQETAKILRKGDAAYDRVKFPIPPFVR